MKTVVL